MLPSAYSTVLSSGERDTTAMEWPLSRNSIDEPSSTRRRSPTTRESGPVR